MSQNMVPQRSSVKKVFYKISQNPQRNTCARVSFYIVSLYKVAGLKTQLIKLVFRKKEDIRLFLVYSISSVIFFAVINFFQYLNDNVVLFFFRNGIDIC